MSPAAAGDWQFTADFDPDVWVPILPEDGEDLQDWALREARQCWAETPVDNPDPDRITETATALLAVAEPVATWPGVRLIHYPSLALPPGPVAWLCAADYTGDDPSAREEQSGIADPANIEPPDVQYVETQVGVATRVWRTFRLAADDPAEPGAGQRVGRVVTYVWELPALAANLTLECGSADLGIMAAIADRLDDLARAVRIVS